MSMPRIAADAANTVLTRLDKMASTIQANYEAWGMPFETAKAVVNDLDKTADEIEEAAFGKESFMRRQAEVVKQEADEKYMATFKNPMQPRQTESDEPYMKAYADDQSSAVIHGVSTTGRPLTPHK
jgi:hypothetical protein